MNKNLQALSDYTEAMRDPLATMKDADKIAKYLGAFNQLVYGVNPFEEKQEEVEVECPDCGSTNCNCPEGIEARKQHE